MHTRLNLLTAGLAASLLIAVAASTASANRLSVNEQNFRVTFAPLTFSADDVGLSAACNVTLSGSFHSRTITKTFNSLIGFINRGTVGTCSAGDSATVLAGTFPWHIQYNGFQGTLPNVIGIRLTLIRVSFQFNVDGTICLAQTTQAEPGSGVAQRDAFSAQLNPFVLDSSRQIDLTGGFFCQIGGDGSFAGPGQVRNAAGTGLLFLSLI